MFPQENALTAGHTVAAIMLIQLVQHSQKRRCVHHDLQHRVGETSVSQVVQPRSATVVALMRPSGVDRSRMEVMVVRDRVVGVCSGRCC